MENIIEVSKNIWQAMHEEDIEQLQKLIHPEAVFVHMGVTLKRDDEFDVIKMKKIVYKQIDVEERAVRKIEGTTIVLSTLTLTAVVGGNEVSNRFVVSEVYIEQANQPKLVSMSYTKIIY